VCHNLSGGSDSIDIGIRNPVQNIYYSKRALKRKTPDLFLQKNKDKPYHIDYCFTSTDIINKVKNVEIGTYDNWIKHSDHSLLIVEFDFGDEENNSG
jgi:exodeoxyribonuclease III